MKRLLNLFVAITSIEVLLLTPLLGSIQVQAATPDPSNASTACNPQQVLQQDQASGTQTFDTNNASNDPSDADPSDGNYLTAVNLNIAKQNPFFDQATFDSQMQDFAKNDNGFYDSSSQTWYFCANENLATAFNPAAIDYNTGQYLSTLSYPVNKLTFDNPLDAYALTGDPCTLFDPVTNICNEAVTTKSVVNSDGTTTTTQTPLYYTDEWNDGHWDAPKADARILQTLVYLVTPLDQGGAGQESIEVGEIIQPGKTDPNFSDSSAVSSHYYDSTNPEHPSTIATGLEITGIGNLRVTTKITTGRKPFSSTSYQYNSLPIKVAYQTDQGVAGATSPVVSNLYQGALSNFTTNLGSLLTSLGLSATVDLTNANLSNIGDIAKLIGGSLITTLLNSPTGSLSGWDVGSLLNNLGRAYIAQQLGLSPNVLAYGDNSDDFVRDIGQATVEQALQLPTGSLAGNTSPDIWGNIGRRFLEDAIGVTPNTLVTGTTYTQQQFLQRIGAGYIEQKLGLQPQSMQTTDWNQITGSIKGKVLFTQTNSVSLDSELNLAFQAQNGGSTDPYGFTAADYKDPVGSMITNHTSTGVTRFLQLVGGRAIELSLGKFTTAVAGTSGLTAGAASNQQCANYCSDPITAINNAFSIQNNVLNPSYVQNGILTATQATQLTQLISSDGNLVGQQSNSDGTLVNQFNATIAIQNIIQAAQANINNKVTQLDNGTLSTNPASPPPPIPPTLPIEDPNLTPPDTCAPNQGESTWLSMQGAITCAEGTLEQYQDGVYTALDTSGQSGMSAALDLPGTLYSVNNDGTIGAPILTTDPVTSFLNGNVSSDLMQAVGRVIIGAKLATSKTGQRSLAGQIQHDTSTLFKTVISSNGTISTNNNTNALVGALNPTLWINSGLQLSDFERIFTKDLSSDTFDQIGAQVMLSAAWNKYGTPLATDLTAGLNSSLGSAASQINTVISDISFYTTRFADLNNLGKTLYAQALQTSQISAPLLQSLQGLNSQNPKQTAADIQNVGLQYESVIAQLKQANNLPVAMQTEIAKAEQDVEEIMAGHPLSFTAAGTSSASVISNACFNPLKIQAYLQAKSTSGFTNIATQTAACRFDQALGLPTGSTYGWYNSKDYTLTGLERAVGQAYATQTGTQLSDDDTVTKGKQILEGTAVKTLVAQIPGIGPLLSKLNITSTDILNLMTGNTTALIEKLGGKTLDSYLHWQPGTGEALINPQCLDPTTKKYVTCSGDDATYVRENVLASAGLQELGLTLNFPGSFNLFGAGDFTTNYGTADISQTLGLSPNSFTGTFASVRNANSSQSILTGLGWYQNTLGQNLTTLITDLGIDPRLAGIQTEAQTALDTLNNKVLDAIADPNSPIWTVTAANLTSPAVATFANQLMSQELDIYNAAINQIEADYTALNVFIPPDTSTKVDIGGLINQEKGQIVTTPNSGQISQIENQMLSFNLRVSALDIQAGTTPGNFKNFITGTGTITADSISKDDGAIKVGQVVDQIVNNHILDGTPFAGIFAPAKGSSTPSVLQQVGIASGCGAGLDLGAFLLGAKSTQQTINCTLASIKGMSLASFFKGFDPATQTGTVGAAAAVDPQVQLARQELLQGLLVSSWGNNFQKSLNLDPGTMAAIALRPQDAPEIAIDQGLKLLGNQIFGSALQNNTAQLNTVVTDFRNSIVAGFCPVDVTATNSQSDLLAIVSAKANCSLDFNKARALADFKNSILNNLGTTVNGVSQFPKGFSLVDVGVLLAGGTQAIYLDGLAHMAAVANGQLPRNANPAFYINFNDIRGAAGLAPLTPGGQAAAGEATAANWIQQNATYLPADAPTMSNADLIAWYENSTSGGYQDPSGTTSNQRLATITYQETQGTTNLSSQAQHVAQTALQYKIYDIAAYSVDPDIPPGFTHAMFDGSKLERAQALELYGLNIIYDHTTLSKIGLTQGEVDALGTFAIQCFGSQGNCDNFGPALTGPLSKIQNYIFQKTGLSSFSPPQNLLEGLIVWASDDFDPNDFMATDNSLGSIKNIPGIGVQLENWGIQQLFTWGDKAFGFPVGSLYQIYTATQTFLAAERTLASINSLVETTNTAAQLANDGTGVVNVIDPASQPGYQQASAAAKAGPGIIAGLVINTVFKSQIASLEKSLGLAPGTGALAISILTQMATTSWAVPWISVAAFIITNVLGIGEVSISQLATGDGYYPYTGKYGGTRLNPLEYPSPNAPVGEFDAQNPKTYQAGLQAAAQAKVFDVLQDLLLMPSRWGAATGVDGKNLWISQVYTARQSDLQNLNYLIVQPPPWKNLNTFGYGTASQRGTISYDSSGNASVTPTQYSGYFYDPGCNNASTLSSLGVSSPSTSPTPTTSPSAAPSVSPGVTSPTPTSSAAAATTAPQCVFGNKIYLRF